MKHFQLSFFGTWGAILDWRRQSFRRQISQSPIMLARHVLFLLVCICHIFVKFRFYGLIVCVREHDIRAAMTTLQWQALCTWAIIPKLFFSSDQHIGAKTLFTYHTWLLIIYVFPDFWIVQVTYQTNSFLEKNRDYVVFEHCNLLSSSKCTFVASLFPPQESSKSNYKFSSVATRFKVLIFPIADSHNNTIVIFWGQWHCLSKQLQNGIV